MQRKLVCKQKKMIEEMMKQGVLPSASSQASVNVSSRSSKSPASAFSSAATATASTTASSSLPANARNNSRLFKAAPEGSSRSASASTTVLIAWEQKKAKEWQVELRIMLEKYGKVGDLIVKKKKAVAVFASATQAAAAVANNQTHPELKFKLKPMLLVDEEQVQVPSAPMISPAPAQYDDDYEAQTLQLLLRRQQEKHTP